MKRLLAASVFALALSFATPAVAQNDDAAVPEFYWQEPGITRGLRNIGTTRIEIVEFEIK